MNFFHSWGKAKISSVNNKNGDNTTVESNTPKGNKTISSVTTPENNLSSRTYYKRKNRKKNFLFTRSLWYDVKKEEKFESKIIKSKSVDNLDSFDEEYFSENLQIIDNESNVIADKREKPSFNTLKKSFSLENLARKATDRGKTKLALTKDMISSPTDFRKLVDNKEFPMFNRFGKIVEENDDVIEVDTEIQQPVDKEFRQDGIKLPVKIKLRRSLSTGFLIHNKERTKRRRSSCPNKLLHTTIICEEPLNPLIYTSENSAVCILKEEPTLSMDIDNINIKGNLVEVKTPTDIDKSSHELTEDTLTSDTVSQPFNEILSDCVDGGTLRKHAKIIVENDVLLRNRKLQILKENELLLIKNQTYVSTKRTVNTSSSSSSVCKRPRMPKLSRITSVIIFQYLAFQ